MSRELLIRLTYGLRFVAACPAGTHFLPVSPTPDDVCCLGSANFCTFFDRRGRVLLLIPLWYLARVLFDLYSWAVFIGFLFMGWLAAPLTHLLFGFLAWFFEGRQSWLGGLVSLAWWLGLFWFLFSVLDNCESVCLLVTRLG